MRTYISGAVSYRRNGNHAAFHEAAALLRANGFHVVNPAELDEGMNTEGWKHSDFLKRDIRELLTCDGIATLPSWTTSQGARAEVELGLALRLPVMSVQEWVTDFEPGGVTP